MQLVVVDDTNVLISGMIWGGIPYRCIEPSQQDRVEGVTCVEILNICGKEGRLSGMSPEVMVKAGLSSSLKMSLLSSAQIVARVT